MIKHLGSKSGNSTQYQWKRWQHRFVGFLEKSQNQGYVYEKCILSVICLGGKNFDIFVWKNKVDGTQNLTYNEKMMPKVLGPTIEKMENWKNWFWIILWSRSRDVMKVGAHVF